MNLFSDNIKDQLQEFLWMQDPGKYTPASHPHPFDKLCLQITDVTE